MRIVHFSDWHGDQYWLPPADLYVCTGDMLPNFRICVFDDGWQGTVEWEDNMELLGEIPRAQPAGTFVMKPPVPKREAALQSRFLDRMGHGYLRKLMADAQAPVVCCRGNHDYIDLAPIFAGGPVFEISDDPSRVMWYPSQDGLLKLGGVRGIKRHHGRWSDELTTEEFSDRVARLPRDLDILVTHAPPEGILDAIPAESLGSGALRSYVARHDPTLPLLKAHLFGHIHESRGTLMLGNTIFSNASRGWHVIDL